MRRHATDLLRNLDLSPSQLELVLAEARGCCPFKAACERKRWRVHAGQGCWCWRNQHAQRTRVTFELYCPLTTTCCAASRDAPSLLNTLDAADAVCLRVISYWLLAKAQFASDFRNRRVTLTRRTPASSP